MSDTDNTTPRPPVVGEHVRTIGTLIRIDGPPPPPPPPPQQYVFRTESARIELLINDVKIKTIAELSDFYGEGTGVTSAIKEARAQMSIMKLSPESDSELRVTRVISYSRYVASTRSREFFYDKRICDLEGIGNGCRRDVPPTEEKLVWTSRNPDQVSD